MIKNINLYNCNIKTALTQNSFEQLKNASILITGANGLIASATIDILNYLNKNNNYNIKIYALVRNSEKAKKRFEGFENINIITQDVTEEIKLSENIDYIIHAASNAHPQVFATDPVGTMQSNFIGIDNILKFACTHNTKNVEYISSGEVYGQADSSIKSFKEDYIR